MRMTTIQRRRAVVSVVGTVALACAGVAAWVWWPARAPAVDAPVGEVVAFMASDRFNELPEDRQRAYMEALRPQFMMIALDQTIPEETKMRAYENVINSHSGVNRRVEEYFRLPAGAARGKYLDGIIAATPVSRPNGVVGRIAGGAAAAARSGLMTSERQKHFIEGISPMRRAQMAEFSAAMEARRAAAGKR